MFKTPWLYQLDQDYICQHHCLSGIEFENKWCVINNGQITVKAGYAWNGCNPKVNVLDLFVIGTPEGRLHLGLPITYHASCVHDVFCQFKHGIPITQKSVVKIFDDMLRDNKFCLRRLYVFMVRHFGPQKFLND